MSGETVYPSVQLPPANGTEISDMYQRAIPVYLKEETCPK
jgi:hypothetical protein